nr:bifunctional hydroxymethylpyrimidine kinase/phosphomethylpyrimidine kinase [Alicyclobacillus contaminans]
MTEKGHVVRALTIAGSDSGGGAGIQADLKTMHQFGVFGMSVLTALTAQNTTGVQAVHEVPVSFVLEQLTSVFTDLRPDAVKTGMLASSAIIRAVADFLQSQPRVPLVVDPVMVAKGGHRLLAADATEALRQTLLPLAAVVTPNVPEAEVLYGERLADWAACHQAARRIAGFGSQVVVVKGGHAPSDGMSATGRWDLSVDVVYTEEQFTYFAAPRVISENTHGTGCTFSAAVAAALASGAAPLAAIAAGKAFVSRAIAGSVGWDVGTGHGPTNHSVPVPASFNPVAGGFYVWDGDNWHEDAAASREWRRFA